MNGSLDLDEVARRPGRYWNADGLPETVMGGLWILWGAASLLPSVLPAGNWLAVYSTLVPVVLVTSGLLANRLVRRLKERVTFPRAGYVAWKEPGAARLIGACAAAAVVAGIVALLAAVSRQGPTAALVTPAAGTLVAAALAFVAARQRLPRFAILAVVAVALGFGLPRAVGAWEIELGLLFLGLGLASLATGAVRLRRFLRSTPLPQEPGP